MKLKNASASYISKLIIQTYEHLLILNNVGQLFLYFLTDYLLFAKHLLALIIKLSTEKIGNIGKF